MDYTVFYKDGDEANSYALTRKQAMAMAADLEDEGYEVMVVSYKDYNDPNDMGKVVYETK